MEIVLECIKGMLLNVGNDKKSVTEKKTQDSRKVNVEMRIFHETRPYFK